MFKIQIKHSEEQNKENLTPVKRSDWLIYLERHQLLWTRVCIIRWMTYRKLAGIYIRVVQKCRFKEQNVIRSTIWHTCSTRRRRYKWNTYFPKITHQLQRTGVQSQEIIFHVHAELPLSLNSCTDLGLHISIQRKQKINYEFRVGKRQKSYHLINYSSYL